MAYTRENKLKLIIEIQKTYQEHKVEGVTQIFVYRKYIYPKYHISLSTLLTYLNTRAQYELKQLLRKKDEKNKTQLNLFK